MNTIDRPRRLPSCATLVVWGAQRLTMAEKVIWYHDWLMDYLESPDGSYMSAKSMAARLGKDVTDRTVEQVRWFLGKHGLYYAFKRQGSHQMGRICILPPECVPKTNKMAAGMCVILDARLPQRSSMGNEPGVQPPMNHVSQNGSAGNEPSSASSVRVEGGKGGVQLLTSSSLSARQLPSVVKVIEEGVVDKSTNGDERRRDGESTPTWLARLGGKVGV